MEYYWALTTKELGVSTLYWSFDNYRTFWDVNGLTPEKAFVDCAKESLSHIDLKYTGNYEIKSFDPGNGYLPDVNKKLILIEVSNGLSAVGPIWSSGAPEEMFKNKQPMGSFQITTK
uniref:Uncharacterized protein n=1 Tax=Marseillevirus LCMAC101 TaxID=2506602 RepID=A0A481YSQ1_9VIRU|nr:MAG: hypothetical protein LCMAC101_05620 [Marseillevirus LCMAC101]